MVLNVSVIEERHLNLKKKDGQISLLRGRRKEKRNPKYKVKEIVGNGGNTQKGARRQGEGEIGLGDKRSS